MGPEMGQPTWKPLDYLQTRTGRSKIIWECGSGQTMQECIEAESKLYD